MSALARPATQVSTSLPTPSVMPNQWFKTHRSGMKLNKQLRALGCQCAQTIDRRRTAWQVNIVPKTVGAKCWKERHGARKSEKDQQ